MNEKWKPVSNRNSNCPFMYALLCYAASNIEINIGFKTIMLDCGTSMANPEPKVCRIAKNERE